jgi:N-methylhydantoinase A/oxoprolinase/acetone carboxylase beta subunit
MGAFITGAWMALEDRVAGEFAKSGIERERIRFTHSVRMQYTGQLNDIEIVSPHPAIESAEHLDALIAEFEDAYGKVYARSARSPELGYVVTHAIVHGSVEVEKPALPELELETGSPPARETRPVHWGDGFTDTDIYRLEDVRAGHSVEGPAVVEHSATTFTIPPGRRARLDRHQIFHLQGA